MTRLAREMSAASSLTPENTLLDRGCVHAAPGCTSLLLSTEVEVVLSQRCVYIYIYIGVCVCVCTTRVQCTSPVPRIRNFTYIGPDATLPLLLSPPILLSIITPPPLFLPTIIISYLDHFDAPKSGKCIQTLARLVDPYTFHTFVRQPRYRYNFLGAVVAFFE